MSPLRLLLPTLAAVAAAPVAAQPAPALEAPPAPVQTEAGEPDILLEVRVRAREARWRQTGDLEIRAWADPGGLQIEESVVTGVPSPIPVGRTFRDIDWRLRAGARLADPAAPAEPPVADAPAETEDGSNTP